MDNRTTLSTWIDSLQSRGQYSFTSKEAVLGLGGRKIAFKRAAARLTPKGRVIVARRGFYVIVPLEYRSAGAPPPSSFIDALMKDWKHSYYVGLLSATALHGAAHQKPQEFQVVTDARLRALRVGRGKIHFFLKSKLTQTPTLSVKTETGYLQVSTPEATALDLVRYSQSVGGFDNVATVLKELSERISPGVLLKMAKEESEVPVLQRLGFLLDHVGAGRVATPMARWLARQKISAVALRPQKVSQGPTTGNRWNLVVNEEVESDI